MGGFLDDLDVFTDHSVAEMTFACAGLADDEDHGRRCLVDIQTVDDGFGHFETIARS